MEPKDFVTHDMTAFCNDYGVREDDKIVAVLEISSRCYEGDLELTEEELQKALEFAQTNDIDESVIAALENGLDMIKLGEAQPDPRNPDLNTLLFADLCAVPKP